MKCWHCDALLPDPEYGKIAFRATCDYCQAALHCCKNCKFYHPGKPNECEVPRTTYIPDRAKANLCEEYRLRKPATLTPTKNISDIEKQLFGETKAEISDLQPKDKFNSLFKDD